MTTANLGRVGAFSIASTATVVLLSGCDLGNLSGPDSVCVDSRTQQVVENQRCADGGSTFVSYLDTSGGRSKPPRLGERVFRGAYAPAPRPPAPPRPPVPAVQRPASPAPNTQRGGFGVGSNNTNSGKSGTAGTAGG